ncbi:MAG: hypothetical protein LBV03_05445 [Fusobacteriales bacterium]|jgi:hypothetical protein|nr:hypothetical protein [Fusobacteriales bacterium]
MKKPLLLNIISIVLMMAGIFCVGVTLLALGKLSPEQLAQIYHTSSPAVYTVHVGYTVILGIALFTSGFLLFTGKEAGRKVFVGSVVIMAVYAVATQGIKGVQSLGIPVLIVIFLYQYRGIKDYLAKAGEDKAENII